MALIDLVEETCCNCKTRFAMSRDLYKIARERREDFTFYCPNGHKQHYVTGETELQKMTRERDRLRQQIAFKDDTIKHERNRVIAAKGQITKLKNRAKAGLCPCCNRSFQNLARHMSTKHPDFDAKVVDLDDARKRA